MTRDEAEEFVAELPWRWVRAEQPDPHQYVIRSWVEVDAELFDRAAALIRAEGYRGRYVQPQSRRPMHNRYLELPDGRVYWWFPVGPQLCRTKIEDRQHERIPEQLTIEEER